MFQSLATRSKAVFSQRLCVRGFITSVAACLFLMVFYQNNAIHQHVSSLLDSAIGVPHEKSDDFNQRLRIDEQLNLLGDDDRLLTTPYVASTDDCSPSQQKYLIPSLSYELRI